MRICTCICIRNCICICISVRGSWVFVVGVFGLRIFVRGAGEDSREETPEATTDHLVAKV